jgi:sulfate adenylyltransferase (ADP) / ATP adenylyltransferase
MNDSPLAAAITRATAHARASGALLPLGIEQSTISGGAFAFSVFCLTSLALKDAAKLFNPNPGARPVNPFLPYEQDLFVANLSDTHVAILNKFPLFERHILMVTRAFEEQLSLLTVPDFATVARTLTELDGLVFYNGGVVAGASQPHKHLQWVPSGTFAIETALPATASCGELQQLPAFHFRHALVALDEDIVADPVKAGPYLHEIFYRTCTHCGITATNDMLPPYNLLAGRRWLLLVPRSVEHWECGTEKVSMNAMSFAGSIFVRRSEHMELVRKAGPMALLNAVTYPA